MDSKTFIDEIINIPGVSGYEKSIAQRISEEFKSFCDEVVIDDFYNVYATKKGNQSSKDAPRILLAAHMDEIGLMVSGIDDRGFIKFTNVGGVDQRILLAQEVTIHGKRDLYGVIGSIPPHLQNVDDNKKAVRMKDMIIDVGLSGEEVRKIVDIGDIITFRSPLTSMCGSVICGKSLDDRAGVVLLYETMKALDKYNFSPEVVFVATVQEEVGTRGAIISTYKNIPDIGIAIDVCHGDTPDASREDTFPLDRGPVIARGPNLHPRLTEKFLEIMDENSMEYQVDIEPGVTGTDARSIQISRWGVPTMLMQIPLRYMHTTVEILDMVTIKKAAKMLAVFIASFEKGWEEWISY